MTKCHTSKLSFGTVKNRYIYSDFNGGSISSDAGGVLLRQVDKKLKLTHQISKVLLDTRESNKITHKLDTLISQQIYALALGYEDLNDHEYLRDDILFQSILGKDNAVASPSTLCRFQNRATRKDAVELNKIFVEIFLSSYKKPPKEIILDFDATDDPTHGNQDGVFYHGYYKHYCFLPLYVFCGSHLLTAYLRKSNIDGAKHSGAILKLLVTRIREEWPECKIVFRGDGGFCRTSILRWCERNNVEYIVGFSRNNRLMNLTQKMRYRVKKNYKKIHKKQKEFTSFTYAAGSWKRERRVIAKAEYLEKGKNNRFVVTSLSGDPQKLYDEIYCARGDMENRIKEQQLDLFADRTSATKWWANQFRLLLSGFAYILLDYIKRVGVKNTKLSKAQSGTIRLKLLKIGAVIVRNTRKIWIHFSSTYPHKELFEKVFLNLSSA